MREIIHLTIVSNSWNVFFRIASCFSSSFFNILLW